MDRGELVCRLGERIGQDVEETDLVGLFFDGDRW